MVAEQRGQAFTLEAFTAGIVILGGVVFALQVTAVTPLTASTSSQHIENQQQHLAGGLLDSAIENESLHTVLLYWNDSDGRFYKTGADNGYYTLGGPADTTFGAMLNRTFGDRGIAFNVNVIYLRTNGGIASEEMVNSGIPSENAASARRTVTLYDNDNLTGPTTTTVKNSTTFYAPDVATDSNLYNVLRVEVVVWRK